MYYPLEHPRKINVWSSFILIAPFLGPVVSAFIVQATTWRWVFGVLTILTGICWVLVVLFLDETFYRPPTADRRIGQPKSRPLRLLGIEQHCRKISNNSPKQAFLQPCLAIVKLPVFLACFYYFFIFAWLIGLNSTISVRVRQVYGFGYKSIGTRPPPSHRKSSLLTCCRLLQLLTDCRPSHRLSRKPSTPEDGHQNLLHTQGRHH